MKPDTKAIRERLEYWRGVSMAPPSQLTGDIRVLLDYVERLQEELAQAKRFTDFWGSKAYRSEAENQRLKKEAQATYELNATMQDALRARIQELEAERPRYVRSQYLIAEWTPEAQSKDILTVEQMLATYGPEKFARIKKDIDDYGFSIRSDNEVQDV